MQWQYQATSTWKGYVDVDANGLIIPTGGGATPAKQKGINIKGFKTPLQGASDDGDAGVFGDAMTAIFGITFMDPIATTTAELV